MQVTWYPKTYSASTDKNSDSKYSYCEANWDLTTDGNGCSPERDIRGRLASFSSRGPTRDYRMKPEVATPGAGVVGA